MSKMTFSSQTSSSMCCSKLLLQIQDWSWHMKQVTWMDFFLIHPLYGNHPFWSWNLAWSSTRTRIDQAPVYHRHFSGILAPQENHPPSIGNTRFFAKVTLQSKQITFCTHPLPGPYFRLANLIRIFRLCFWYDVLRRKKSSDLILVSPDKPPPISRVSLRVQKLSMIADRVTSDGGLPLLASSHTTSPSINRKGNFFPSPVIIPKLFFINRSLHKSALQFQETFLIDWLLLSGQFLLLLGLHPGIKNTLKWKTVVKGACKNRVSKSICCES